jgi:hypothetical protein
LSIQAAAALVEQIPAGFESAAGVIDFKTAPFSGSPWMIVGDLLGQLCSCGSVRVMGPRVSMTRASAALAE